jgi:hypothetical protein
VSAGRRRVRGQRALLLVSALLLAAGGGGVFVGSALRASARERWARVAEHVGEAGYEPAQSDALYLEVERWDEHLRAARRVALGGGAGLALGLAWRRRRPRGETPPEGG